MKKKVLRKYINIMLIVILMGSLSSPGFVHADPGNGNPGNCDNTPSNPNCAKVDKTAPSSPTINLSPNITDWTNQNVTFTLTPGKDNQGGSGVVKTEYKIGDNGVWQLYSGQTVIVPGEGEITIIATSTDNSGNTSVEATAVVKLDKTAPSSPILTASPNDWTNQDKVTVTLSSGTDSLSGVFKNQYKIGNGTWTDYLNSPVEITSEGITTIYGRTIDIAGNISNQGQTEVKIDRSGPTLPTIIPSASSWTNQDVTFTITSGADSGSGVQKTQYKIGTDNENWIDYSNDALVKVTNEGETRVYARTLDNVNNPSTVAEATIKIDRTGSTSPSIILTPSTWTNGTVTFSVQNGEKISGSPVVKSQYKINDGDWQDYEVPSVIDTEGLTKITARTIDEAGNYSHETNEYAKIDTHAPTSPEIIPSTTDWTNQNVTFTLTPGVDEVNGSGVRETQYKIGENGTYIKYEGKVTIESEGQTVIFARTVDDAGNTSESVSVTVKFDKTAPSEPGISSNHPDWTKENVIVTLTDGLDEQNGSGYKKTQYKIDDGDWQDYTSPIDFDQAGEYKVYARSVDIAGNKTVTTPIDVKIDRTGPTQPTVNANTEWTNGDSVTVTIDEGTDSDSGVEKTEYSFGNSDEWVVYNSPFQVTTEGITTIHARSIDYVGNTGEEREIQVRIDRTAPDEPTIHLSRTDWTNQAVTFTIENINDDRSGVSKVMYKIGDDGEWLDYTPGDIITVEKEGITPIYVKVVDNAGNINDEATEDVKYDITPPTKPTFDVSPVDVEWAKEDVTVTINEGEELTNVNEDISGVNQTEYRLEESNEWIKYIDPIQISRNGTTTIYSRTIDIAGNVSETNQVTVKIDKESPSEPKITLSKEGWTNQDVTISIEEGRDQEGLSGVAKTEYKVGDGQWEPYNEPFTISEQGSKTILARTIDNAGNVSDNEAATVNIDKTGPQITVSGNQEIYQVDQLIQIKCLSNDTESGLASPCQDYSANAYELGLGDKKVTFTATDNAGNPNSVDVTFKVVVTYSSLEKLTTLLITNQDIAHSLIVKLEAAQESLKRGNIKTANNQKNAYKNEVLAQRGKTLTADQATTLLKLLEEL
ncbi:OmpL47-type beta-barrel domain-containing protein [Neobacillus sp. SAB-20_R2A]|uniref:OmpL47-type beta-barrel domain-containing protein n=1 Tax=Neobacillus sp. SAB-20_R2A TaxID=3120519 RepID=UPI003C6E4576